jgi:hypothetical protein
MSQHKMEKDINKDHLPYPDDETEDISPDVGGDAKKPLSPAEAVKREQDRYGETSADQNREDQRDMHGGTADDIV